MQVKRHSGERGSFDFGWLKTSHSFSFGDYHDPAHMGFGPLRVINDDQIGPGQGFDEHPHRDMEIVTVVLSGALAHRDSLGNGTTITPGEVQRMSAGTGIRHSEFNALKDAVTTLLQIWIMPEAKGLAPGYEQTRFDFSALGPHLIASRSGEAGSVVVHQNIKLYRVNLQKFLTLPIEPSHRVWLQMISGNAKTATESLTSGDGLAISGELAVTLSPGPQGADLLLFDME